MARSRSWAASVVVPEIDGDAEAFARPELEGRVIRQDRGLPLADLQRDVVLDARLRHARRHPSSSSARAQYLLFLRPSRARHRSGPGPCSLCSARARRTGIPRRTRTAPPAEACPGGTSKRRCPAGGGGCAQGRTQVSPAFLRLAFSLMRLVRWKASIAASRRVQGDDVVVVGWRRHARPGERSGTPARPSNRPRSAGSWRDRPRTFSNSHPRAAASSRVCRSNRSSGSTPISMKVNWR